MGTIGVMSPAVPSLIVTPSPAQRSESPCFSSVQLVVFYESDDTFVFQKNDIAKMNLVVGWGRVSNEFLCYKSRVWFYQFGPAAGSRLQSI